MKNRAEKIIIGIFTLLILGLIFVHFKYITPLYRVVNTTEAARELTMEEKLEDFEYMYNILRENHPYFEVKKRTLYYDWLGDKELFRRWIEESKDDIDFYNTIDIILTSIQNGHTHLLYPDEMEEYRRVFSGSRDEWSRVLNSSKVLERYKLWRSQEENQSYNPEGGLYALPIAFKYIEGNYAADEEKSVVPFDELNIENGSVLLGINSMTPDEYVLKQIDYEELSYDYKRKKYKIDPLTIWAEKGSKVLLKFKRTNGKVVEIKLEAIPDMEPALGESDMEIKAAALQEGRLGYLKVPSFDYLQIDKDREKIYDFLKSIKDYPYLIIDIRGNSGGSDAYWKNNIVAPLINEEIKLDFNFAFRNGSYIKSFMEYISRNEGSLKEVVSLPGNKSYPTELKGDFGYYINLSMDVKPRRPVGFKGKIFLLTDDRVYSSAESFAAFAKESKWATLVGTPTGGDGICYDPALFELPNSGLVIRFPVGMGLNPDGTSNEEYHTQPDIYVEESYIEFLNNINRDEKERFDAALNMVINMMNQAGNP